jgi:hypothetical protein
VSLPETEGHGHLNDAWAGHWNVGYAFKNMYTQPRPFVEYSYASGNQNPNGNTWARTTKFILRLTTKWTSPISLAEGT